MPTYYVRPDGNDANTGLGSSAGQAWQTITKAVGATGITSGDTLYVAPGTYRSTTGFTIAPSYTSVTQILADPTAAQFSGINAGPVRLSVFSPNDTSAGTTATVLAGTTNNLTISDFEIYAYTGHGIFITGSSNIVIQRCILFGAAATPKCAIQIFSNGATTSNTLGTAIKIIRNIIYGFRDGIAVLHYALDGVTGYYVFIQNNFVCGCTRYGTIIAFPDNTSTYQCTGTTIVTNNVITCVTGVGTFDAFRQDNSQGALIYANNLILNCVIATQTATGTLSITQSNTRIINCANNGYAGSNQQTTGIPGIDIGQGYLHNLVSLQFGSSTAGSPNAAYGTATNALATDLYNVPWTGATPDAGAITYKSLATLTPTYQPTDRQSSGITIAPGSTSQSIEVYLGVTGLTATTAGLSARYNRSRTASVNIPLVVRTIGQSWISGGFAEVDAVNMPGIYRVDIPDAALAVGVDDVTVVVRGASGTNGAVMTIKLSSGGLTSAQTASAVWGASVAGYIAETEFGGVVNATRNVVGGLEVSVQDIPQTVWDEPKANHTIPNTFGDYLDTKVSTGADTSRIQLRQGPFLIKQNATEGLITEVNQFLSTVPNMEIVLIDSSGGAVSVAGSTLVLRVRNQAGTAVVNNVTPTVAYADGGVIRWTPNLSWNALSVTTPGTYRIIVERTMGTTTTTFGPFLVQLSSG
jgi:hypothetical protein